MARYANTTTKTGGAAAAAMASLSTGSARDVRVYEIGLTITTAVAGEVGIVRPNNTPGTPSGGQVGNPLDNISGAGVAALHNTWATTQPTIAAGTAFRRMQFPATIGAGVVWTFPTGIVIPTSGWLLVWQFSATTGVGYSIYVEYEE